MYIKDYSETALLISEYREVSRLWRCSRSMSYNGEDLPGGLKL